MSDGQPGSTGPKVEIGQPGAGSDGVMAYDPSTNRCMTRKVRADGGPESDSPAPGHNESHIIRLLGMAETLHFLDDSIEHVGSALALQAMHACN